MSRHKQSKSLGLVQRHPTILEVAEVTAQDTPKPAQYRTPTPVPEEKGFVQRRSVRLVPDQKPICQSDYWK